MQFIITHMKKRYFKLILFSLTFLLFFALTFQGAHGQTLHDSSIVNELEHVEERITELPRPSEVLPFDHTTLSPCPNPEREPRFVYRENVVHEERQFRAEHSGCGGNILMRKWQVVGIQVGTCGMDVRDAGEECDEPIWLEDKYIAYYDRYVPEEQGIVFEEVGSWQKAWPPTDLPEDAAADGAGGTNPEDAWRTEEQLMEEYGEPVPFPVCQSDCLQPPPGVPGELGDFDQEDPYYFNNPWLPEIIGGEVPDNIDILREKNILGGSDPLRRVSLPTKLFWWNVPGWHDGWIEDGELQECEGPEDIACVNHYVIRFDNINREDRPAKFHRHEVINRLMEEGFDYSEASRVFEELEEENHRTYQDYRRTETPDLFRRGLVTDTRYILDVMRYDRDNIIDCDECGVEKEIWLDENSFNPLEFDPVYDYERPQREWMMDHMLDKFDGSDPIDEEIQDIIRDTYQSYGRPSFFRSGSEQTYSLQAACKPHDYLEKSEDMDRGEGRWGPEANFSFETSDSPEPISPIDPNWVSPYDPKKYDPGYDPTRLKAEEYDYDEGYVYPWEDEMREEENLSSLGADSFRNLWGSSTGNLILQDRVAFREELEWAQQWYQPYPTRRPYENVLWGRRPRPPELYKLSFGEGTRVTSSTETSFDGPVLEDCHTQLTDTFEENPICSYKTRPREHHESQHIYPGPNHLDQELEYFTLPEDEEIDIYSWNVSTCRDRGEIDCTDFSQMWRFQMDQEEVKEMIPPSAGNPKNEKRPGVSMDDATTGLPFTLQWNRRFGARSYVYRLREEGEDWKEAKILTGNQVRYEVEDLEVDTEYEWDVKACWDQETDHPYENYQVNQIINWAENNKECSEWREDYDPSHAPFRFKTTGHPPEEMTPEGGADSEFPINFKWEEIPGAESYVLALYEQDVGITMASLTDTGGMGGDFEGGFVTSDPDYLHERGINFWDDLGNPQQYIWAVASCVLPPEEDDDFLFYETTVEEMQEELICGSASDWTVFIPSMPAPENLSPGESDISDPERIPLADSYQELSWDEVEGADYYLVDIDGESEDIITDSTSIVYEFEELGNFGWSVSACSDSDCHVYRRSEASHAYVEIFSEALTDGIVPCGREVNIFDPAQPVDSRDDCEPAHLFVLFGLIIQEILLKMVIPYSLVVLLLYTGYALYTGMGDTRTMQRVYKLWNAALKGYVLILASWLIVGAVLTLIGYQFGVWWEISEYLNI